MLKVNFHSILTKLYLPISLYHHLLTRLISEIKYQCPDKKRRLVIIGNVSNVDVTVSRHRELGNART